MNQKQVQLKWIKKKEKKMHIVYACQNVSSISIQILSIYMFQVCYQVFKLKTPHKSNSQINTVG